MDQIEELDVYCANYTPNSAASAGNSASVAVTAASAVTSAATEATPVEVDCLEKALGIEFSDPNGVVQRQLLAK